MNCITNTFIQADTLNITYSITLLLLRRWEGRRFTNWSSGGKSLVNKERHNSDSAKYHNTYLPPWLHRNRKSRRNTEKCIAYPIWLQCLMQLMWSNIRSDPQIKDKTEQRTVLVVMILYIHVNRSLEPESPCFPGQFII